MSVDDGHGREGHPLDELLRNMVGDSEGVWRDGAGNPINDAPISREGNFAYQQGRRAQAAADGVTAMEIIRHLAATDPLFEEKRDRLRAGSDPEVVAQVNDDPVAFLQGYDAVTSNLESEDRDAPRNYQLETLRVQLREHDEEHGPRATPMRERILSRIASLHTGGR